MRIEFGRDPRTGFPCVRAEDMRDFVAVLPVTKLQAEEWIWREGARNPDGVTALMERLAVDCGGERFPDAVRRLERVPIGKLKMETALSVLASNLTQWTAPEETHDVRAAFPTPSSEWGRLLDWLGGRVPRYSEWRRAEDAFARVSTSELLHQILTRWHGWPVFVESLLWKVRELASRDARGLPFMGRGLYEMISDTEPLERLVGGLMQEVRPRVAGDSPIWPALGGASSRPDWRALRNPLLPVVTVRPWFSDLPVVSSFEMDEQPLEDRQSVADAWRIGVRRRALPPYVKSPDKMRNRCPFCHEPVPAETFDRSPTFDCLETRIEVEQKDGSRVAQKIREHKYVPAQQGGQVVARAYLDVARKHPQRVHTVAMAGYTGAGKTTWLLSFGGLMNYPDGRSAVFSAFPSSWRLVKRSCAVHDLVRGGGTVDPRPATEAMWLDGALPTRTAQATKAARDPILFRCTPGWWREQELLLVFDDMAGEAISDPKMVTNENFPHFASTADAIYIVPTDNMSASILDEFGKRLEQAQSDGAPIDLKKTNLIFVISKIDRLKYGSLLERDLLGRILPRPYKLPRDGDVAELKAYIEEMEEVHWGIADWLRRYKPEFFQFFDLFGSVRFCGLSAFGFQPLAELEASNDEFSLPFRPDPVRVVDPVFWLLKENGLISF